MKRIKARQNTINSISWFRNGWKKGKRSSLQKTAKEYPGSWHRLSDGRRISGVYTYIIEHKKNKCKINSSFFNSIVDCISKDRLDAYRQDRASETITFARYAWNTALSRCFYPALQLSEIALRNSIHAAFSNHFSSDTWFDCQNIQLSKYSITSINNAKKKLSNNNKPVTAGRVIAELHLGFWTAFFNNNYASTKLSSIVLRNAFPNCPKQLRTIKTQNARWERIRILRNRIFHHERIIHWKDIKAQHEQLLETLGWMNSDLLELTESLDDFSDVYQNGIDPWIELALTYWPDK